MCHGFHVAYGGIFLLGIRGFSALYYRHYAQPGDKVIHRACGKRVMLVDKLAANLLSTQLRTYFRLVDKSVTSGFDIG